MVLSWKAEARIGKCDMVPIRHLASSGVGGRTVRRLFDLKRIFSTDLPVVVVVVGFLYEGWGWGWGLSTFNTVPLGLGEVV